MRFLQDSDYTLYIKPNVLNQILGNDLSVLSSFEDSSILEMAGYFGVRFDTNAIFAVINDYDSSVSFPLLTRVKYIEPDFESSVNYSIGDRVDFTDGNIYQCIQATTGTQDPTDSAYWSIVQESGLLYNVIAEDGTTVGSKPDIATTEYSLGDTRNRWVIQILIDIVLYHACSRINPRNVPDLRFDRYQEAKDQLKKINKGELFGLGLPEQQENADFAPSVIYGNSTIKQSTYY